MKSAIVAVTLAVCIGKSLVGEPKFTFLPPDQGRLATENFTRELQGVLQRDWHRGDYRRKKYADVFQFKTDIGPGNSNASVLFVNTGYGLYLGRMTQYKFSFIREAGDCRVGFTHALYFGGKGATGLGLYLREGVLAGGDGSFFVSDVGKESNDLDWFIEFYEDRHVEVYMTLKGQPLGMAYRVPYSGWDDFATELRPIVRCNVADTTDSENVIAVIQYFPMIIPVDRPYAAQRKPDGKNFEYLLPFSEVVKLMFGFDYRLALHLKVNDDNNLSLGGLIERHRCNSTYQPDGVVVPAKHLCLAYDHVLVERDLDFKREISTTFEDFLDYGNHNQRLRSGDLIFHSKKFGSLVLTPLVHFEPVVIPAFLVKGLPPQFFAIS